MLSDVQSELETALAYVNARSKAEVVPMATPIVNGAASYHGYIITSPETGITTLQGLKGHTMAFVDLKSASGYAYPRLLLKKAGVNPDTDLAERVFLGTHSKVVDEVMEGSVKEGATYSEALDSAREQGKEVNKLVYLAKTDPIPKDCIAASPSLDPNIVEKLKNALIDYKNGATASRGKTNVIDGFVPAKDENYDIVREVERESR